MVRRATVQSRAALVSLVLLVCALTVAVGALAGSGAAAGSAATSSDLAASSGTFAASSGLASAPASSAAASDVALAPASDAPSARSAPTDAATPQDDAIVETVEHRLLPEQPDRVEAEIRYAIPEDVPELRFGIHRGRYDVVATEGFERVGDGRFEWDGQTDEPRITIRHAVDESFRPEDPDEAYVGGTDEWAVVARPQTATEWSYYGSDPGVEYRYAVDGEGRAGKRLAYLGSHEVHQRDVAGERLTLVVPDEAELASSPDEILDSLAHASDRLRVGGRNDEAFLVATPTNGHDWTPPGLSLTSDARVVDDAAVDERVDVWVHEYVHTRQNRDHFDPETEAVSDDARWLVEGSADYYAALLSVEQGHVDFGTFQDVLERGSRGAADDAVLSDPDTWEADANYKKGALVAAALDREIRRASDGSHTLQDVLAEWNRDETFTAADLEDAVAEYGDESVREFLREHTHTDATPEPIDRATYREYFDVEVAQFDRRVASDPPLTVEGPYRSGALAPPLVTGETVASEVRVENVGDVSGRYRVVLSIGGERADEATGRLSPGESETVRLEHELQRTGDLAVVVGDHSRRVRVREPAAPGVRAQVPQRVVAGQPFDVSAEVRNSANRPAASDVELRADGEVIASREVTLGPNETTTVEIDGVIDEPGEYQVSVGGDPVTVEVREATIVDELPGFGLPAAVAGLLVALALLASRRRSRRD